MKEVSAKAKYDIEYAKKHLKRVPLDMQIERYEDLKQAAERAGEKINEYIKKAIFQRIERESMGAGSKNSLSCENITL